jgi:hypothetical protein
MPIAMTSLQRRELEENGFTVLERLVQGEELERIREGMCGCPGGRGAHVASEQVRALVDHPRVLPLIVDACGWNIQVRESIYSVAQPAGGPGAGAGAVQPDRLATGFHHDYEEEFMGVTVDGVMPIFDFKASWYLSDHTEPGHAATLLVPGSHRWSTTQRASWQAWLHPEAVVPLRVPAGSVVLWRSSMLHGVAPNLSHSVRQHLYIAYVPRWIRPTSITEAGELEGSRWTEILRASEPVRRQLLGANGDLTHPLAESGASQHWFPSSWERVPLKAWAEEAARSAGGEKGPLAQEGVFDWGCNGPHGAPFARGPSHLLQLRGLLPRGYPTADSLTKVPGLTIGRTTTTAVAPPPPTLYDIHQLGSGGSDDARQQGMNVERTSPSEQEALVGYTNFLNVHMRQEYNAVYSRESAAAAAALALKNAAAAAQALGEAQAREDGTMAAEVRELREENARLRACLRRAAL